MTADQVAQLRVGMRVVWFGRFYTVEAIGLSPEGTNPLLTLSRMDYRTGQTLPYRLVYASHPELEYY